MLRAYGRFIEGLKVDSLPERRHIFNDFVDAGAETKVRGGIAPEYGGSGIPRAGVRCVPGIKASVSELSGKDDLRSIKVAVQGVSKVGSKCAASQ